MRLKLASGAAGFKKRSQQKGVTVPQVMVMLLVLGIVTFLGTNAYQDSRSQAQLERVRSQLQDFLSRLSVHKAENRVYTMNFADLGGSQGSVHLSGATGYLFQLAVCPGETVATCVQITAKPGPDAVISNEILADTRQRWEEHPPT